MLLRKKQIICDPLEIGGRILSLSRAVLDEITATLAEADCTRDDAVYAECFPVEPATWSAVVSDLLVDAQAEVEVVTYQPVGRGD